MLTEEQVQAIQREHRHLTKGEIRKFDRDWDEAVYIARNCGKRLKCMVLAPEKNSKA